ncbi:uncharacterized protein LOC6571137 [Drosophila grimshawi]|uniref:GH18730 n=1 Tax=Drosophila grimshawi TaxID=7222 RepID=B4JGG4_DROGR|nr:uncharacterized protein LOC6571137 [Drosophila grimshawi]EDV92633.1 GH18730 [Drosophila grimshawi]EDW04493.1 GH23188 [Drosophila grimshawi]
MRQIVFLSFLAICSAELGYQYHPNSGYETDQALGNSYSSQEADDHYNEHADFHKHFYAFAAPYDSGDEADLVEDKISALSKKNLQVVFIRAPENKVIEGALHALATQTNEDKTAIYVLNKQTDSNELASKLSALQAQHKHKPVVHFVKYRTEEEAALAQQQIQALYGGATGQSLHPTPQPSLGYSQLAARPSQDFYSQEPIHPPPPPPPPSPEPGYLPPLPNYGNIPQPYDAGAYRGNIDLPPLPLPEQQLDPSPYDLDARTARARRIDFRVNERHRSDSPMVFPTETPTKRYLPTISNSYLPPRKRRRRAHF